MLLFLGNIYADLLQLIHSFMEPLAKDSMLANDCTVNTAAVASFGLYDEVLLFCFFITTFQEL